MYEEEAGRYPLTYLVTHFE